MTAFRTYKHDLRNVIPLCVVSFGVKIFFITHPSLLFIVRLSVKVLVFCILRTSGSSSPLCNRGLFMTAFSKVVPN